VGQTGFTTWEAADEASPFLARGIYIDRGGTLMKILDEEDTLDGKGLSVFELGPEVLSGDQIAFLAAFDDSSTAI